MHDEFFGVSALVVDGDIVFEVPHIRAAISARSSWSCSVCGVEAAKSNQNLSLNPMESTTSVSPSQVPIESPYQVGSKSAGARCWRPSRKIWR